MARRFSNHPVQSTVAECPLSRVKRTHGFAAHMSAFDPKRTLLGRPDTVPCPEPGETMRRREFITLLGGAAAGLWPIAAYAQQPVRVVGFVSSGSADGFMHLLAALHQGLRDKGYVD